MSYENTEIYSDDHHIAFTGWSDAPEEATHYAAGSYLKRFSESEWYRFSKDGALSDWVLSGSIHVLSDYAVNPNIDADAFDASLEQKLKNNLNKIDRLLNRSIEQRKYIHVFSRLEQ